MRHLRLSHIVYAKGFTSQTHPGGPRSFTDEEWIEAFSSRYSFWVLRVAEELLRNDPDSGFAALLTLFPYFEMITRHREGKEVKPYCKGFKKGILHVFSESELGDTPEIRDRVIEFLWKNMRNELSTTTEFMLEVPR